MKFIRQISVLTAFLLMGFGLHKYYVSMTKIEYVEEKKDLQIIMRFFIDDVETCLNSHYERSFELNTSDELPKTDNYLNLYIHQKFTITIDEKPVKYEYLGKEYKNDLILIYLEATGIDGIQSIAVQNRMLFEEFEEQQHFVKLKIYDVQKTFILTKDADKDLLKL